jgi:eukaryotic translation initiation factor 2C
VPNLITVPGRVLHSPDVKYHGNKVASTRFGGWNMANIQFATRVDLSNWKYLWISVQGSPDPWRDAQALKVTIDAFTTALRSVGIYASDCTKGMHITVDGSRPEAAIDNAIHVFSSTPGRPPPKLVLVILPSTDSTIYNRVKYACDVKEGIINVCVVASKFSRANPQYHANVALKVNLKLGGRNQFLDNSKLGIIAENKTMLVGIDVTHPAPGSSANSPSVASIVASVDQWLAQWPAELRIQTGRQEMVANLDELLKSRLRLWKAKHNDYPENMLIYRDGVSEGQYNIVLEQELPALRKACEALYPPPLTKRGFPRMTIAIVGKRHNTRFYPTKKEDADRSSNPQNGTIVDRGVTEARNWDFFLQAHTAIQGTARPAHYYIVYDEIFQAQKVLPPFTNAADMVEDLTHNLCYMYGRATKAVSICPPAYYADLVCDRARCYLGGLMDPSSSGPPTASVASGQMSSSGQAADPSRVKIHDRVKDTMFYI